MLNTRFDIIAFARANWRPVAWFVGGVAVLTFFLYVVLPFIASTRIVKERIAFELSVWSGYQVSIQSDPEIRLFPLRAVLNGVRLTEWTGDGKPVLEADEFVMNLSPTSALMGDIYFSKVRLVKPTLWVEPYASGLYLPRLPGAGRMANAVKDAQVLTASNPDDPDLSTLGGDPFGTVEFFDGRILDAVDGSEIVNALEGIVTWPRLDRGGALKASGAWRGERVIVEFSSNEPMLLLAGGTANLHFAFAGAPGNATFDGRVNLSAQPFFDGEAAFATSSLRQTLEWSRADIASTPDLSAVSISGRVQGGQNRIKLENLQLVLDGSSGSGAMELQLGQSRPSLSGTLAFQRINLGSIMSALSPVGGENGTTLDTTFTERLNLDLRLSSTEATAGPIAMTEVAATAQIRDGLAVFDISDARAFDGSLQAGLRFDITASGVEMGTSVRATDIDGGALGSTLGLTRAVPSSRGSFSLMLKGPVERWDHVSDGLEGTFSANFGKGTLVGVDLPAFLKRTSDGGFFSLEDVSQGTLPLDRLDLQTTITRNLVHVDRAELVSGQHRVQLSGLVSYIGGGLALSGSVATAAADSGQAAPGARFFVGGSLSEPFISPQTSPQ
ncbi:MAG: AsmA-like C-terminal region-containing protein [Rhizobiaceae bacterium]